MQRAIFGGGCFWCAEAIFQNLKGVKQVISGYMGGELKHPTYMEITHGDTGHAEVIQIDFDENEISFEELLTIFFGTHNPTLLNKQGQDIGSQYRSVVFYQNEDQKLKTNKKIYQLTSEGIFDKKILTEVSPASDFYDAEDYHQNYYNQNHGKPYCAFVIQPKLDKLAIDFRDKIKPEYLANYFSNVSKAC
ncbi:peptide-methionine (S)-S-oxide reductase MsrA [Pedobacter mucosus]|uniref:peptide-methionine (S)-S-oxide reductase MsrA n=1 Tax=Pedobacter mucosus TaxID=2895286 RepID=UPI001EE49126|nr:peptide-methionine (S)-S-oxide reductase MsrA [Pedobacter mucosus]UKT64342.1 peptide-methionine (S)-S-oxide reductase MsrA [Pedobacter mucosus]